MSKLTRQLDGTYLTDTNKNLGNLDAAASRGGTTDIANINYAKTKYGYTPPAGAKSGISNVNPALPTTGSLVPDNVPEPENESDIFNLMTRDALLKFQGVNTAELEKKKRALQQTAIGEQASLTPEDLRTFSPAQQDAIRSGNIKALQPEFDDVAYQLNKANQATTNFENVFEKVMAINKEYSEKIVAPESVIASYKQLIEADPTNVNTYLAKVNDKTREAILGVLDYTKMKPKEDSKKASISEQLAADAAGKTITYDKEGNPILTENDLTKPGAVGGQCGDYLHKVADNIPAMGDSFEQKMKMANISPSKFEVGDVLIQQTSMPYGHVSIVKAVNGDQATVIESNYGLDEKVGERTITYGDPSIAGVYRGANFKQQESGSDDNSIAQSLVDGDILLSELSTRLGKNVTESEKVKYMKLAQQIDPKFSPNENKLRYDFKKRWTTGDLMNNRIAINTSLGHLASLKIAADALDNTKLQKYNTIEKLIEKETGDPKVAEFEFNLNLLASEMAKIYKGGNAAPTEMEIQEMRKVMTVNYSPAQFGAVFNKAAELLGSKLTSTLYEYENVIGNKPKDPIIDPNKIQELQNAGIDTSKLSEEVSIRVQVISTGETGTIPASEFNASIYKKI